MDYTNRIQVLMHALKVNQKGLAEKMGVSRGIISEFASGAREPSKEFIFGISKLGISIDWFLTGEGSMFLDKSTRQAPSDDVSTEVKAHVMPAIRPEIPREEMTKLPGFVEGFNEVYLGYPKDVEVLTFRRGVAMPIKTEPNDPTGMVLLPLYCQRASAGPGEVATQLPETEHMVPILYDAIGSRNPKRCGIIQVRGDSMSDLTLFNGDWALFDQSDREGDGVFVISMYGEMRIKRLQYRLSTQEIVISSENRARYPDPEIVKKAVLEGGHLIIYGRVFAWIHKHQH